MEVPTPGEWDSMVENSIACMRSDKETNQHTVYIDWVHWNQREGTDDEKRRVLDSFLSIFFHPGAQWVLE